MGQKTTIDAIFALAYRLYTCADPVLPVTGAPNLVKLLTQDIKDVTGGLLNVEKGVVKTPETIHQHIEAKRKRLGIRTNTFPFSFFSVHRLVYPPHQF